MNGVKLKLNNSIQNGFVIGNGFSRYNMRKEVKKRKE